MEAETIEQFVSNLEKTFDPNEIIDFDAKKFKYIQMKPGNEEVRENTAGYWSEKNSDWHILIAFSGDSKVSEIISALKEYLPKYKDNVIAMQNNNNDYSLIYTHRLIKAFGIDHTEKKQYSLKHPFIIRHNNKFVSKRCWAIFNPKMLDFIAGKPEGKTKSLLKIASYTLEYQKTIDRTFELTPYFYSKTFYQSYEDVLTAFPDAKDVKFTIYKGIMVSDDCLADIGKKSRVDDKTFKVDTDFFSMKELLEKYALTEAQLSGFFVEEDVEKDKLSNSKQAGKRFVCKQLELLKMFEKD